jgi:hypothetical protein
MQAVRRLAQIALLSSVAGCLDLPEKFESKKTHGGDPGASVGADGDPSDPSATHDATASGVIEGLEARPGSERGTLVLTAKTKNLPEDAAAYTVEIRRAAGEAAPKDCDSGDKAGELRPDKTLEFQDGNLPELRYLSYRVCLREPGGRIAADATVAKAVAQSDHALFVTSIEFPTDLSAAFADAAALPGVSIPASTTAAQGADRRCQALAERAGFGGTWAGLLASPRLGAAPTREQIVVTKPVRNIKGEQLAASDVALWMGTLDKPVRYDETGAEVAASQPVLTGTTDAGEQSPAGPCYEAADAKGVDVILGRADAQNGEWMQWRREACPAKARLYCISQDLPRIDSFVVGQDGGVGEVTVRFALSAGATSGLAPIVVKRQPIADGASFTNPNGVCSNVQVPVFKTSEPGASDLSYTDDSGVVGSERAFVHCLSDKTGVLRQAAYVRTRTRAANCSDLTVTECSAFCSALGRTCLRGGAAVPSDTRLYWYPTNPCTDANAKKMALPAGVTGCNLIPGPGPKWGSCLCNAK